MKKEERETLVEEALQYIEESKPVERLHLSPEEKEFTGKSYLDFPEFVWYWKEWGKVIVVNLIRNDLEGLGIEDYFTASDRIRIEAFHQIDTKTISVKRKKVFVALAKKYGIKIEFVNVAELPKQVVREVEVRLEEQMVGRLNLV